MAGKRQDGGKTTRWLTRSVDRNEMVDDDRIGRMKQRVKSLRNVGELHFEAIEDLRQVAIAIDEFSFVRILTRFEVKRDKITIWRMKA